MNLTFTYRGTCTLCGHRLRGVWSTSARINKGGFRTTRGLIFRDHQCQECGFEAHSAPDVWALTGESARAVSEYRVRKYGAGA